MAVRGLNKTFRVLKPKKACISASFSQKLVGRVQVDGFKYANTFNSLSVIVSESDLSSHIGSGSPSCALVCRISRQRLIL